MEEVVRKTLIQEFESAIDILIKEDMNTNPHNWNSNPFYPALVITNTIRAAEVEYKNMLSENSREFGIDISEIDSFIESLSKKTYNKYFE